jgi:cytochrome c biogenesis protein CcmG/thiol:disulfide interchange protein DsbE
MSVAQLYEPHIYRPHMSRPRLSLVAFATALVVVAAACSSSEPTSTSAPPASGDVEIAPTFTVPTNDGGEFSLAEHITQDGRPIFLNLWASWCFPCREEMPAIDRSSKAFPEIAFVGVSVQDSTPDAEKFIDEMGVTYLIGFDEENELDSAYKPLGLPASYIISGDGVIVERIFGKVTEEDLADKFEHHFGIRLGG